MRGEWVAVPLVLMLKQNYAITFSAVMGSLSRIALGNRQYICYFEHTKITFIERSPPV